MTKRLLALLLTLVTFGSSAQFIVINGGRSGTAPPSGGAFTPPYALPDPGENIDLVSSEATAGNDSFWDINPAALSDAQWTYGVFNCWNGAAVAPEYSEGGAYIRPLSGGHGCPRNMGTVIFDFTDGTWTRIDAQGADYSATDYTVAQSTGSPDYEVSGISELPLPAHNYNTPVYIPASLGGDSPLGSVLLPSRHALTDGAAGVRGSATSYQGNLNTGVYSKKDAHDGETTEPVHHAVLDAARGRVWMLSNNQLIYSRIDYYDTATATWSRTAAGSSWPSDGATGSIFMHEGLLIRHGSNNTIGGPYDLWAYNPDDNTITNLTVSGTLPSNIVSWAYLERTNKYYHFTDAGGTTLTRLTPPSVGNALAGTWTVDTVSISPGVSAYSTAAGSSPEHYRSLIGVDSIGMLAWFAGEGNPVELVNPE
jgi:hypothetical protein